jgi:integral membrane protein
MLRLTSPLGRLRLLGLAEGLSLLILVGIAVPFKYLGHDPTLVRAMGPVHGLLFLLYVLNTLRVGVEYSWRFQQTTWKVLLACIVPFGTFYIDHHILAPLQRRVGT